MQSAKPAILLFVVAMFVLSLLAAAIFSPAMEGRAEAQSGTNVSQTPKYKVLGTLDATGMRKVEVATPAKTETGFRLVADKLREDNVPQDGTLLVEFNKSSDPSVGTGFALVFDNKKAVLDAGRGETSLQYGDPYDREEAQHIMKQEDGMRVVGFKEFAEDNPDVWKESRSFLR